MTKRSAFIYLTVIGLILLAVSAWYGASFLNRASAPAEFDGEHALEDVKTQVSFGPRIPETAGHAQVEAWIRSELEAAGWTVDVQSSQMMNHPIDNLVAKRGDELPEIIIGAHYDSRIYADHDPDPDLRMRPVPGANDGASGVAVLLGLARSLPDDIPPTWLVFFDAEDNGDIPGWDWLLGSRAFVAQNPIKPRAVIGTGIFRIRDGIDIDDCGADFFGNLGELRRQTDRGRDLKLLRVGTIDLRFFSIDPMGHNRPNQDAGRQRHQNREGGTQATRAELLHPYFPDVHV